MNNHWIYFCFSVAFFPTEKYFKIYEIPTFTKGNKNRKHIDSLTKELQVCDMNYITIRLPCVVYDEIPDSICSGTRMMSNEPSEQSCKCFQASRSFEHSLSAGKKKSLNSKKTKSIRSEAGNWKIRRMGGNRDLPEEATVQCWV